MKAGIIGGSGYTGRELVKLLMRHRHIEKIHVYGRTSGEPLSKEIRELKGGYEEVVKPIEPEKILKETDVVFVALPHGVSMEYCPQFLGKTLLIDLSADYRLTSPEAFKKWYGSEHKDPSMLGKFVYGLPEINREKIKKARHIANPGCYPTSVILGTLPLVEKGFVKGSIIADSKSGHSGAGKKMTEILHAGNITENIQPYKLLNHQHIGEMEQVITEQNGGKEINLTFTPYVVPFDRGILSAIYIDLAKPLTQAELDALYLERFRDEPFVRLLEPSKPPTPKNCAHTNFCDICAVVNEKLGRVTVISCIDNLVKGASGQAVQNMNIACGFDEKEGLI